jgi:hypothetical protein
MIKKITFVIYLLISLTLLVYLILPGPTAITDFSALPGSIKSSLEGDTIQVPNVAAYFSDNFRHIAVNYYKNEYKSKTLFPFPPLRLNHPPEDAYTAIKDQTESTYLEEYTYPLRDSLYINGLEPLNEDGTPRYNGASKIKIDGGEYSTKVIIRYYPSKLLSRVILWIGINFAIVAVYMMGRKIFSK